MSPVGVTTMVAIKRLMVGEYGITLVQVSEHAPRSSGDSSTATAGGRPR